MTSSKPGAGKSGTPSTQTQSSPGMRSNQSRTSYPLEIAVLKWSSPTLQTARMLRTTVDSLMMGLSKMTSPEFPGWALSWQLFGQLENGVPSTTTRLVLYVSPEAELPF